MQTKSLSPVRCGLLFLLAAASGGCMPATEEADAVDESAVIAESRVPVYRSAKRLSSDCGSVRAPGELPGLAPVAGGKIKEMSERDVMQVAIGTEREPVATDYDRVSPGFVVVGPTAVKEKVIVNNDKEIVGRFEDDYFSGHVEILDNGDRVIASTVFTDHFMSGGRGGCVERYTADGRLLWRVKINDDDYMSHHDIVMLNNGNFLAIVWELVSTDAVIEQGRDPEAIAENGQHWYDGIIEVDPYSLEIVWEWSARHHLIQDFDPAMRNYGVVSEHPELIDINLVDRRVRDNSVRADWTHFNSIDYHKELEQILVSSPNLSEILIIDHSTTPWESMGHTGGRYGKGGDILYRWGNSENYGRGSKEDRQLYRQHDAHWIAAGMPGAGNILILNNGLYEERPYTTATEITLPIAADGSYPIRDGEAFGPAELAWEYSPAPPERFLAWFISGVQRLPNGNTLINQGPAGRLREVTASGEIVWDYEYKGVHDAAYMMFRAIKYPPDHPGIARYLASRN